jgi:lipid A 3-O-deacylase
VTCDPSRRVFVALRTSSRPCQWCHKIIVPLAVISILNPLWQAHANVPNPIENRSTFIFYLENDLFSGTDKYYTNALKLSWISKDLEKISHDQELPGWARWIVERTPTVNKDDFLHNLALSLGQNIYTPRDITEEDLIEDERPYAGWTYLSAALHSKSFQLLNTLELSLGIVGPSSHAEEVQKLVHKWSGSNEPQGWDNQLQDEPGVMLTWQRFRRILRTPVGNAFAFDAIPHAGLTLGNVFTYANLGGEIRFGYNLPADFGTSLIRPGGGVACPVGMNDPRCGSSMDFGLTVFMGADGRAVARNIFLDGNTCKDSHSVDKNHFVADISAGFSVVYKRVKLTYTHVYRTEEFKGQDGGLFFGSISLAVTF